MSRSDLEPGCVAIIVGARLCDTVAYSDDFHLAIHQLGHEVEIVRPFPDPTNTTCEAGCCAVCAADWLRDVYDRFGYDDVYDDVGGSEIHRANLRLIGRREWFEPEKLSRSAPA